ncbi:hypothetical protein BIY26_13190 [Brenneria goodwinii]|uniref:Uncharacterized protein n=1 Tax=Brenneria goodwinii TaxID=1109412 RepID=A0A0G4JSK8_9GAMM|nr:CesT family type III secretion system chaperone [Brenneria goodwinii]ATA25753.1 hypothetical protein AWC36_17475 [Brenneria goodwinii]MCG8156011.1 CesT family type III secretion system chaperone [Brenneria goodwinii]MCG8161853.1 CesT family type III secretion system chaperone [Brenneria goodwinii]MCG8166470.1 CesT family type III secretion system chaperone [Brenneria goodwinii]MCG8169549.1 CesT family type III secretion system chaperone [Brenneria goodwinii]
MSESNYAKSLLIRWVEKQVKVSATPDVETGVQVMFNEQTLFLKLPQSRENLFVFMPIYTLDFERDGDLLALGMMLNLEHELMCGAAIGLDAYQRTLMLTAHQDIRAFDDRTLNALMENVVSLGLRIREEFASVVNGRKIPANVKTAPLSKTNPYRTPPHHSQF